MSNYYLKEFTLFDGEKDIIFNIIDVNKEKMIITLAVSNQGKISIMDFDLLQDIDNSLYFQYGVEHTKVNVEDFETIND